MKTLTLTEAVKNGFKVHRAGINSYLPVETPREISIADAQGIIAEQFDPRWEIEGNEGDGYFTQIIEDTRGTLGLPGTRYLVRAHYSHNDGIQDWQVWCVVKINA